MAHGANGSHEGGGMVIGDWGLNNKHTSLGSPNSTSSVLGVDVGPGVVTDPEAPGYYNGTLTVPSPDVQDKTSAPGLPEGEGPTVLKSNQAPLDARTGGGTVGAVGKASEEEEDRSQSVLSLEGIPVVDIDRVSGVGVAAPAATVSGELVTPVLRGAFRSGINAALGALRGDGEAHPAQPLGRGQGTAMARYGVSFSGGASQPSFYERLETRYRKNVGGPSEALSLSQVRADTGPEAATKIGETVDPAIADGPLGRVLRIQAGLAATSLFDAGANAADTVHLFWGGVDQRPHAAAGKRNTQLTALQEKAVQGAIDTVLGPHPTLVSAQRAMDALNEGLNEPAEKLEILPFPGNGRMYVHGGKLAAAFERHATPEGNMYLRVAKVDQAVREDGAKREIVTQLHVAVQDNNDPSITHAIVIGPGLVHAAGGRQEITYDSHGKPVDWHRGWPEVIAAQALQTPKYKTNVVAAHLPSPGMVVDRRSGEARQEGSPWVSLYDKDALGKVLSWLSYPGAVGRLAVAANDVVMQQPSGSRLSLGPPITLDEPTPPTGSL